MGQRSVRFPDELIARAEARAAELDRSFSWVVVRALESALDGAGRSPAEVTSGGKSPERKIDAPPPASARASVPEHPKVTKASKLPPPQFNRAKRLG